MKYIILNFSYGYGPFLRTTELAFKINSLLEKRGKNRYGIIIPLVYGELQKKIMQDNFLNIFEKYSDEILFDDNLGFFFKKIFYKGNNYDNFLKNYLNNYKSINNKIKKYLKNNLVVKNFQGKEFKINSKNIEFELSRMPLLNYGFKKAFFTGFAHTSLILENFIKEPSFNFNESLFKKSISFYKNIESNYDVHFIATPGTFSCLKNKQKDFLEIITPPSIDFTGQKTEFNFIKRGIYVTVSGIPNMEKYFSEIKDIGLQIYSNKIGIFKNSIQISPSILGNKNIGFHFARSGWGSIWLSFLKNTVLIVPEYRKGDDPEIYYNNICIEKFKLGIIYRGQSLEEIILLKNKYLKEYSLIKKNLIKKFGTLNGVNYTAKKIINYL